MTDCILPRTASDGWRRSSPARSRRMLRHAHRRRSGSAGHETSPLDARHARCLPGGGQSVGAGLPGMRLDDKVAIVTGAASGFGAGIARRFAREGARSSSTTSMRPVRQRVARDDRRRGRPRRRVRGRRIEATPTSRDSSLRDRSRSADSTSSSTTPGTTHRNQPMLDVTEEEFDRIYRGQREEPVSTAKHAVPHFRAQAQRRVHHDRVDGRRAAAARAHLVQRQQGRGDRDVALDGGGARAATTSAST